MLGTMSPSRRKSTFDNDIDYIVSPEYRMSRSTATTQGVYVDNEGTLHDSEYKMFPHTEMSRKRRRGIRLIGRERRTSMTGLISDEMSEDEDYESNDDEEQPDPFRGYSPRYAPQSYYSSGALTASNSSAIVHNHRHSYAHETPSNPLPPRHINLDTYPSTPAAMAKYEAKRARLYPYSSTTLPRTSMDRGRGWPFNSVSLIEESNDNPFESSPTAVDDTSPSSYSSGGSEKWGLKRWSRISSISKPVHSNDYTDEFAVVNEKSAVQTIPEEAEVQRLIPQLRNVLHRKKEPLQRTYTDPVPEPVSEQEVRQDSSPKVLKKDRNDDEDDYVPTCTDAIRQQWYTMSLSLRLGLHRTKLKLILRGTGGGNR